MGNLIQVLQGDYVIFVTISEMCSGDKKRGKFNPRSIKPYGDGIYDWKTHISIAKVISGYEPNFSSKPSKYKTFEREDWDGEPGTKVFTQFFGIEINANDTYCRDGMQKNREYLENYFINQYQNIPSLQRQFKNHLLAEI